MKKAILVFTTVVGFSGVLSACGSPVKHKDKSDRQVSLIEQLNRRN